MVELNDVSGYTDQLETLQSEEHEFDVIGHPKSDFKFAVTFPFHPDSRGKQFCEVTLLQEYAQGVNSLTYCLPTGSFDPKKHKTLEDCAVAELSEEAHLQGGELVRLLPPEHLGIAEVKWCANRFVPFLSVAPQADLAPGSRDAEEFIYKVMRVSIPRLQEIMISGDMMLPSMTTCFMALEQLKLRGLL